MSEIDHDDDPIVRGLLPGYVARRREEIDKLDGALADGDFETLRTIGHNLHGSGGAYGLPPISAMGKRLEQAARAADAAAAATILAELRAFLGTL